MKKERIREDFRKAIDGVLNENTMKRIKENRIVKMVFESELTVVKRGGP